MIRSLILPCSLFVLSSLLVACGDDEPVLDGGTDAATDVSVDDSSTEDAGESCEFVTRDCPAEVPPLGSPCAGEFECTYAAGRGFPDWQLRCEDGVFQGELPCPEPPIPGAACASPPLTQSCASPYEGPALSASIEIGPVPVAGAPFRPFETGDRVESQIGGQGTEMFEFALRVTGADEVQCADLRASMRDTDGSELSNGGVSGRVGLSCGESYRVFGIVPEFDCEPGVKSFTLRVELVGVGETEMELELETVGCLG